MSLSNAAENDLMKFLFNATAWANIADDAASGPVANWRYGLHTADPGETGAQNTNEAGHAPYARQSVARTTAGHTVTNNAASPAANIDFPACTSGTATVTHMSVGKATSGTGYLLVSGTVSPSISVSAGVTPRLSTATTISAD